jgi:hypothetical protein
LKRSTLLRSLVIGALLMACTIPAYSQQPDRRAGIYRGRVVTYELVDGLAVYQGDIILENPQDLAGPPGGISPLGFGISYTNFLWPQVGAVYQVPYVVTGAPGNVAGAVASFNNALGDVIQFVPRTAEDNYVSFNLDAGNQSGVCFSNEGMIGGMQQISGAANCATPTLLHEMGHTIGLYHEQSRPDRDTYINIFYENVIKGSRAEFDQIMDNSQSSGGYDYRSVMHYGPFGFGRNGEPTIDSIPPGIPLSNTVGYSDGDLDFIRRLYMAAPAAITVSSNPPGLQVIVDGVTITTPQVFTWDLNATHTLDVPAGSQALAGTFYTYGRWSDDPAAQHTITITPGVGTLVSPSTFPATTLYIANFIELVPFTSSVFPNNSGTVIATPPPASFPPAPGLYYVARQPVSLQATPNAGFNFYGWFGLPGAMSRNPKPARAPATVQAAFTTSPVTTMNASSPERWIWVDGTFFYAPKNFALSYDPTWTSGSSHTVSVMISPQLPFSINSRYAFASWSDGGAQSHSITVPPASSSVTANFTAQYAPVAYANQGCAGTVSLSPSSPDGFYSAGTTVMFTESTNAGWTFTGWHGDLAGTANPQSLVVNDEVLAWVDFNTTDVPLAIAALTPPSATAGDGDLTLTIDGAGFTPDSIAFVGGVFRAPTFVSSTQLTLPIFAADLAAAGSFQVGISNFPPGAACSAFVGRPLTVLNPPM